MGNCSPFTYSKQEISVTFQLLSIFHPLCAISYRFLSGLSHTNVFYLFFAFYQSCHSSGSILHQPLVYYSDSGKNSILLSTFHPHDTKTSA